MNEDERDQLLVDALQLVNDEFVVPMTLAMSTFALAIGLNPTVGSAVAVMLRSQAERCNLCQSDEC